MLPNETVSLTVNASQLLWVQAASGVKYSVTLSNNLGLSDIFAVNFTSATTWSKLPKDTVVQPYITSDRTKVGFLSSTNSFDSGMILGIMVTGTPTS